MSRFALCTMSTRFSRPFPCRRLPSFSLQPIASMYTLPLPQARGGDVQPFSFLRPSRQRPIPWNHLPISVCLRVNSSSPPEPRGEPLHIYTLEGVSVVYAALDEIGSLWASV